MSHSSLEFDPNAAASSDSGLFGLPHTQDSAQLVLIPVPWEVTTSYGGGTSQGPARILQASKQVDLFDLEVLKPYEAGIFLQPLSDEVLAWNEELKPHAEAVIASLGRAEPSILAAHLRAVNQGGIRLNAWVKKQTSELLQQGKIVGILGGDHSTPYGAFQALAERTPEGFGILHFDAHSDTRKAYEGFEWSHASIFYNTLETLPEVHQLTQVGIRDLCEAELNYLESQGDRVRFFPDLALKRRQHAGESWSQICDSIVQGLPKQLWISFDIDGLDPRYCPHTGTPVPGGLDFSEANALISAVVRSGRKILGFDLTEVAPHPQNPEDEWDANVGARLLYKLSAWTLASQGLAPIRSPL
jgi:agmatinase